MYLCIRQRREGLPSVVNEFETLTPPVVNPSKIEDAPFRMTPANGREEEEASNLLAATRTSLSNDDSTFQVGYK
jgi:hypothetical protein